MKYMVIIPIFILVITGMGLFYAYTAGIKPDVDYPKQYLPIVSTPTAVLQPEKTDMPVLSPAMSPTPVQNIESLELEFIDNYVPFTSQAPLGQWSESEFQDGCEEASVLMAVYWAQGKDIASAQEATRLIQDMSDWQHERYGEFRDRSAADTAQMIKDYFQYDHIRLETDITVNDIKGALASGGVVVVPAAGRELKNPNFTPPGPLNHMLVIRGYDPATREFITNDPGTRNGEGFRYNEEMLFNAIRDYPTGYKEPITKVEKNMIVVFRE